MRVALFEDDPRYRESLAQVLALAPGFELAGAWPTATAGIAAAAADWDLVVMDLDLPDLSGIEATRRLKERFPRLSVVVVTVFEEPATILSAICAGADGYLLKRTPVGELLAGLRSVREGGSPLTAAVARSLVEVARQAGRPAAPAPARLDLTEREREVLRALAEGRAYKQVAADLDMSLDTVRTHIRAIYRKLQVHSVTEAVSRAIRQGLV